MAFLQGLDLFDFRVGKPNAACFEVTLNPTKGNGLINHCQNEQRWMGPNLDYLPWE